MNDLEVITLTKSSLAKAISENKFWGNTYEPPFSINKAKWMLENERADAEDVFAVLGYENHTIIAFISLMPDLIKVKNGDLNKVFWSQRWWVADKFRNTVLPTYTKSISLNEVKNQVLVRFLGDNTEAYYKKHSFTKFSERPRSIIVFNLDYKMLIYKKGFLKKIQPILKLIDKTSNKLSLTINKGKSKKRTKGLIIEPVEALEGENWNFVNDFCANDVVPKTKAYVNWQITNSQYHQITKTIPALNYKCLLKSISNKVYNINLIVKKDNQIIGFVSALVKGSRFLLRYFLANNNEFEKCVDALMLHFVKSKCTLIQTENKALAKSIKSRYFNVYSDEKPLLSVVHNDVNINSKDFIISDRDGNFV